MADDDAQGGLDAGLGPGSLMIGKRCVTLLVDEVGREVTLIWRSGQTRWDPLTGQILFDDRDLGLVRLSSGDRVMLGGASLEDPDSPDQGAPQPSWISQPDESCSGLRFVVHQLVPLDESDDDRAWGPLAVVRSTGDTAGIEGRLRVTEECVFIEEQGEAVILVWPADRTAWDPAARAISFRRRDDEVVTLRSGESFALGGGGSSEAEDGLSGEEWASTVEWIVPPAPTCLTETRWFVSDVKRL